MDKAIALLNTLNGLLNGFPLIDPAEIIWENLKHDKGHYCPAGKSLEECKMMIPDSLFCARETAQSRKLNGRHSNPGERMREFFLNRTQAMYGSFFFSNNHACEGMSGIRSQMDPATKKITFIAPNEEKLDTRGVCGFYPKNFPNYILQNDENRFQMKIEAWENSRFVAAIEIKVEAQGKNAGRPNIKLRNFRSHAEFRHSAKRTEYLCTWY